MKFSTNWDIDYYKTDYESEEHWELRKRFMEIHKDKFPEDELVCLAQVFTNVEFMGCKYPDETMRMVNDLSKDVAAEFREQRSKRLKRTFVKASDAAEQRAKGRRGDNYKESNTFNISAELKATKLTDYDDGSDDDANYFRPCFSGAPPKKNTKSITGIPTTNNYWKLLDKNLNGTSLMGVFQQNLQQRNTFSSIKNTINDLFTGNLKFGRFILFYAANDRNCLAVSAQKSNMQINEKETSLDDEKLIEIFVGSTLAGSAKAPNSKEAKSKAFDSAVKKLKHECYVIKPNPNPDRINISKNNEKIFANLQRSQTDELKLDSNNIGYKMMLKQGWTGGGLGSRTQGRENPIDFLVKNNRKGFGNDSAEINSNYFRTILSNYIKSEDIRDLYFESGFTKEERATLHQIASSKHLKSASRGKEPNRHLIISKKTITPYRILEEVLLKKNAVYENKFEVKVPRCKASEFPEHTRFKL